MEFVNLDVLLFPPTESALSQLCYPNTLNWETFVELFWTFYLLLLNVYVSAVATYGNPGIFRTLGKKTMLHFVVDLSDWPSLFHFVEMKGWLTFKKPDFRHRLCIRGHTREGVHFPCHPRCRHVHLKVWFRRRNWRRGAAVQLSYLHILIWAEWKPFWNGYEITEWYY